MNKIIGIMELLNYKEQQQSYDNSDFYKEYRIYCTNIYVKHSKYIRTCYKLIDQFEQFGLPKECLHIIKQYSSFTIKPP